MNGRKKSPISAAPVQQAEIMASSNDTDIKSHTRIAQLAIERAKRHRRSRQACVYSARLHYTRTARAFNNATGGGGRTMSGGIDARAMEIPRKIFAAARNTEEAGSLTIVATAFIDTGSRMDELIFQEFKGTGNMELVLDRKISDQRVYPAVDIFLSGTRREELLLQAWELEKINMIRRGLAGHKPVRSDRASAHVREEVSDERADAEGNPRLTDSGRERLRGRTPRVPSKHFDGPPLQEVEWEVLPPEAKGAAQTARATLSLDRASHG